MWTAIVGKLGWIAIDTPTRIVERADVIRGNLRDATPDDVHDRCVGVRGGGSLRLEVPEGVDDVVGVRVHDTLSICSVACSRVRIYIGYIFARSLSVDDL